jgi:hypothetical protein
MPKLIDAPCVWSRYRARPADAIYVGRPSGWGNPFVIGRDGTREEVIEKYRRHVEGMDKTQRAKWLKPLRGKHLVCWCAPLPCHADILFEFANGDEAD